MRRFWNERAREDPYFFVDNRLEYGNPDIERFWSDGEKDLELLLGAVGASVAAEDRVLDIGCGLGRLTRPLAARAAEVIALDVSEEMLSQAKELNPDLDNVRWLQGSGTDLGGIERASVGACVSHVVFQHIPDPQITLGYVEEMARVLRPRGWSAFQVSNDPEVHRPRLGIRARLRALVGRAPRGQANPAWLGSHIDLNELEEVARSSGLELARVAGKGTQHCIVLLRRVR